MKLGLSIGYSKAKMDLPVALVQRAEELGYDSVWSAEAYGSDAITPLAYLAAVTKKIRLGTGIMQLAAAGSLRDWACPVRKSSRGGMDNRGDGRITG
jgi:hypothetical protein